MLGVKISEYLTSKLGAELSIDDLVVDVELHHGRLYTALVVTKGRFITGRRNDANGVFNLLFSSEDITDLKLHAFVYARRQRS